MSQLYERTQPVSSLPNFSVTPLKGSRDWLAGVLDETFREDPSKNYLRAIWVLLPDAMVSEEVCDALIGLLLFIRGRVDGTLPDQVHQEVDQLRSAGQKEYARDEEDAFANFKRVAKVLDACPRQVLVTYLAKHLDGIESFLDGHRSQREGVQGRINDAIVYLVILKGMIRADV